MSPPTRCATNFQTVLHSVALPFLAVLRMCLITIDLSLHVTVSSDRTTSCKKIVSLRRLHTINNMVKLSHRSIRFRSFFDLIVKKYEINKSPKCTPFWHKMFKIASFSGAPPQIPLGGLGPPPPPPPPPPLSL